MRAEIPIPTCLACPAYLLFEARYAVKQNGVLMKLGERYCLFKKRAVRFRSNDPKSLPPSWCPKRKSPCEVRVYGFKSTEDWYLHEMLCRDLGKERQPLAHNYCVEEELTTDLTPKQFWDGQKDHFLSELLPATVLSHWVIEIDDGLKPVCFYKTENGLVIAPTFDTAKARVNKKEDDS